MNKFNATEVVDVVGDSEFYAAMLELATPLQAQCASPKVLAAARKVISDTRAIAKKQGYNHCLDALADIEIALQPDQVLGATVVSELRHARNVLKKELSHRTFLEVAKDRADLVDAASPFGKEVYDAFPSARFDVTEAGNCLAAETNTAAVFHLMRAAEYGLRALAKDRRIRRLPKAHHPIELATWEDILKELEKAEMAIQGYPRTMAREAQYAFYHGALMQFRRFKNVFRNPVMHTRDTFGCSQAWAVFENVRDFMQHLASRVSETNTTPIIWKGKKWTT